MEILIVPLLLCALLDGVAWLVFRNAVKWSRRELLLPFVPVAAWILFEAVLPHSGKSLSNFFIEIFALLLLPAAYIAARRFGFREAMSWLAFVGVCIGFSAVALIVVMTVPPLPE